MLQVREKYELRSNKSQDTSKTNTPEVTIKKRPEKISKATSANNKTATESLVNIRRRTTKTTKNKFNQPAVLALQLVLLIQLFQTLYIVRKHQMTQLLRQRQIKQS